jgi:hypothetical protein
MRYTGSLYKETATPRAWLRELLAQPGCATFTSCHVPSAFRRAETGRNPRAPKPAGNYYQHPGSAFQDWAQLAWGRGATDRARCLSD